MAREIQTKYQRINKYRNRNLKTMPSQRDVFVTSPFRFYNDSFHYTFDSIQIVNCITHHFLLLLNVLLQYYIERYLNFNIITLSLSYTRVRSVYDVKQVVFYVKLTLTTLTQYKGQCICFKIFLKL